MVTPESVMGVIRGARPSFRSAHEKAAFAVHATFLASGYALHATGPPAFTDDAFSATSTEVEVGPDGWNEFEDSYGFVYSNTEISPKKVMVKCLYLNGKLLVDAIKEGDSEELLHLEIPVGDYVAEEGGGNSSYRAMYKDFDKLVKLIDGEMVSKFDSRKKNEGSSSDKPSSEKSANIEESDLFVSDPAPYPGYIVPPIPDTGGHSDIFPGPGAGVYPHRGDHGGPRGMLVGPDDPMFFGGVRGPRMPGGFQPGVPPGARFDPYGPPGIPGFEPNRFIRDPRRPGSGNHPDLEPFRDGSDFI